MATAGVLYPMTLTLGAQLAHRAAGGQAPWWVGMVWGVAGGALGVFGRFAALQGDHSLPAYYGALSGIAAGSALVPTLAFERSHRRRAPLREQYPHDREHRDHAPVIS